VANDEGGEDACCNDGRRLIYVCGNDEVGGEHARCNDGSGLMYLGAYDEVRGEVS